MTATKKTPPKPEDGKTRATQDGESSPRLPHERDESSDSQRNSDGTATDVGKRAHDDVERGAVDTDRGPVTDRVYNDKVKR
ncbi:hypothetical protein [Variovorax sp. UMC13]|uniref:hypothetical protein n=1 Tax=Variovorax sp. UMC13 TaxID=1862326 RepID=UPI0016044E9C|nr:hypothetical protein [Variovorax sp. UMC13]MBB1598537.1 hypothetical protein [Variovorax sp. UMC13]